MSFPAPVIYLLTIAAAVSDWVGVARGWSRVRFLTKPAVAALLLLWLYLATGLQGAMVYFGLGLLFSLIGDLFLLFDTQGWFLAGLVAFLLALVAYTIGFNATPPATDLFSILMAILVAVLFARLYRRVAAGLLVKGLGRLRIPTLIYTMALALMLLSALLTLFRHDWLPLASLFAALGAALFVASDTLLAWNRFVTPLQRGPLVSIILYHVGQMLLIAGVVLNYLNK
jgi:uncharacterized membrane protein YhhN